MSTLTNPDQPNPDLRRLVVPKNVQEDAKALELVSAWFTAGSVSVITRTGAGLDSNPEFWGEILAAIGNNAAVSAEQLAKADRNEMLAKMKAALDKRWEAMEKVKGEYYPPERG
jgi:hypothetical protein